MSTSTSAGSSTQRNIPPFTRGQRDPSGIPHVFVGAGQGPCAVLMIGARRNQTVHYPVDEVAARYDASVSSPTDEPAEAYADWRREPRRPTAVDWPPGASST